MERSGLMEAPAQQQEHDESGILVERDEWEDVSSSENESVSDEGFLGSPMGQRSPRDTDASKIRGCGRHRPDPFLSIYKEESSSFADDFSFNCAQCMATVPQAPNLCGMCQKWNVSETIFKSSFGDDQDFVERRSLQEYLLRKTCMVCQLLGEAVLEKLQGQETTQHEDLAVVNCGPYWFDRMEGYSESFPLMNLASKGYESDCVFLLVASAPERRFLDAGRDRRDLSQRALSETWQDASIAVRLNLRYHAPDIGLLSAERMESPYIDFKEVQSLVQDLRSSIEEGWESEAELDSEEDLNQESPTQLQQPSRLRLVDTQSLCIVQPEYTDDLCYATLSYLWASSIGQPNRDLIRSSEKELSKPGALRQDNQPLVIWDAIILCQDLEIPYFWTDRLCAIQNDVDDLSFQISQMDRIYGNAFVTIVDVVDHGLDLGVSGVRGRPRRSSTMDHSLKFDHDSPRVLHNIAEAVDDYIWNTRGWTFQERMMSKRLLFISNFQWHITSNDVQQENFGSIGDYHTSALISRKTLHSPNDIHLFEWDYVNLVEHYTRRKLTYGKDVLAAFTGVANVISMQSKTEHLFGLFADHFDQYLLWGYVGSAGRRMDTNDSIPSWSWAAWDGSAWYHSIFEDFYHDSTNTGKLVTYRIVNSHGRLSKPKIKETWFKDYDGSAFDRPRV